MAPVIKELEAHKDTITSKVCVSAQHRELLDQVLHVFKITPDYDLNIMSPGQSLTDITSKVAAGIQGILASEKFDWMIVQGDTTTVVSASLAAFYSGVHVAHVEAGLRSNNREHPYPEEINRRLLTVIAERHFAPTASAHQNLLKENVPPDQVFVTGNTVVDALLRTLDMKYDLQKSALRSIPFDKKIILVTVHRRESFGKPIENVCRAVKEIAQKFDKDVRIVWPVHPNPNVKPVVHKILGQQENVSLIEPINYVDICQLMRRSHLILTDSGGIQEEAPTLSVPVLVMRETTERTEAIEAGVARLTGTDSKKIVEAASELISDPRVYAAMSAKSNPFGDGHSAERIVSTFI
jgi:UDP-N-acetylglucosamine 2-epimerase (non-hydrolysing)